MNPYKRIELITREKDGPSPLKKIWSPKPTKGQALRPMKWREKKKKAKSPAYQDQKIKESPVGRIGSGYLEVARGSRSLGRATQLGWDWDSSKRAPRNTKNEGQIRPSQSSCNAERNQKAWRIKIHEQGAGTSSNPERRTIKKSSRENYQPGRNGFGSPGKNDKKKDNQKAESEKGKD